MYNMIKMDEIKSSDMTMVASHIFNDIIDQVQRSCLNFQVQLSPFSALISLKKSLVNDKSGNPVHPTMHLSHVPSDTMEELMADI